MHAVRNSFADDKWVLKKIDNLALCTSFDCDDEDLNDYFQNEAVQYRNELLTQTYYLHVVGYPSKAIALLDFCNDAVHIEQYKKDVELHPSKQVRHLPAVKLARFGVCKEYQRRSIGTYAINLVKRLFVTDNRTGCRLLIVDAYNKPEVLSFYKKNDFKPFTETARGKVKPTSVLFFDLKRYVFST